MSNFFVYLIGIALMVTIYFAIGKLVGGQQKVTYHLVERVLIFGLALILVLVAIFY